MKILILILLLGSSAVAEKSFWKFEAKLDGKDFGYHSFRVMEENDIVKVKSTAEYDYYLAFVRVFKYRHQAQEEWSGKCLTKINSKTDNDGDDQFITTIENKSSLKVKTHNGISEYKECVGAYSYWNVKYLDRDRLYNPQTGEFAESTLKKIGSEELLFEGKKFSTDIYMLNAGKEQIKLWYSTEGEVWMKLSSKLENGKILDYHLIETNLLGS